MQKYGHMYYHFVQEVLPRIILLRPYLDADTKLLTFGSPYELKWLAELGIPEHMIEVYDPSAQYCAEELLVPNMSPIVTPPKENYDLVRGWIFYGIANVLAYEYACTSDGTHGLSCASHCRSPHPAPHIPLCMPPNTHCHLPHTAPRNFPRR